MRADNVKDQYKGQKSYWMIHPCSSFQCKEKNSFMFTSMSTHKEKCRERGMTAATCTTLEHFSARTHARARTHTHTHTLKPLPCKRSAIGIQYEWVSLKQFEIIQTIDSEAHAVSLNLTTQSTKHVQT
jgi:hypothetical protein